MRKLVLQIINKILSRAGLIKYRVVFSDVPPLVSAMRENELTVVDRKYMKWIFLRCPCGCGDLLNLSLMASHDPNWKLKLDYLNRPTIYPSIWKKDGCESHFWITKGKIHWVKDNQRNRWKVWL